MIAKVGDSTSILKTQHYLIEKNPKRVDWEHPQHLASTDREFVIDQMREVAKNSQTDEPIYHYSISWDTSDNPTRQQMIQAGTQTLQDLGLGEHQAVLVAHNDHDYKHLHVMVNRVHPVKGTAWNRYRDYIKLEQSLRVIERQHGWKEVPGHHHQLEGQQEPEYGNSLNKFECAQIKKGETPLYMLIREHAEHDFREAKSWEDLHQRLAEKGLTIQRGSRGRGGKVTDGYEYTNLSKIRRDFSMGRLEKRFGPFRSLQELQQGKQLTDIQHAFACFERAHRLGRRRKARSFKKGLGKTLKALGTARKVQAAISSLLSVSTSSNPALKLAGMMGKTIINQIEQEHQRSRGRGR
ncbi:relaxase/mobilization nuclease domain-containing protein [Fodinibius halophilus]|uniref:Relaxase/mobilization nuclease domain-containing protein n=1 Tax=Fodinibius halophilus TaxID=1736908 RepID=A0A6M1T7H4_9BACT|nr:relaxase/mobilization nuclease domain-containing protein [Fodinibius halophilus]NGP90177.1 relaxase/mobilization nuclease domain-containing protein [Fodinibius halophilus]